MSKPTAKPVTAQEPEEPAFARPRVFVSRCLGFEACRWDGAMLRDDFVARLGAHADLVTRCPEAEIGLGTPRPPVRIALRGDEPRLMQPESGRDLTDTMRVWTTATLDALGPIDGFILKSRSPSCGPRDVKHYADAGPDAMASAKGPGLFAAQVLQRFGEGAVEDEGRLTNFVIRERFLIRIFAFAELRAARATGRMSELVDFHARHKFLLMAAREAAMRQLGNIVANREGLTPDAVFVEYARTFSGVFDAPWRRGAVINAMEHAFGFFKKSLTPAEKKHYIQLVRRYRERRAPLAAPIALLASWSEREGYDYLRRQSLLRPYPADLIDLTDSAKGRGDL
ncbi:MAG: DUF1722 domain-containing protein [Deltaproteobacteria bacterium]|nr:DUF1722 domain-containing protein [Deltaproteobacteria bacterium]